MEFFDVIKNRYSIRRFKEKEVEDEKLRLIFETVNLAPSAGNLQAYDIFLIRDKNKKELLAKASYDQNFIKQAPVVLIFCANTKRSEYYGEKGRKLYCLQDATIAASYAQLAATNLGLGSVWVGGFDENEVLKILGSPRHSIPVAIIPIGYPDEKPKRRKRRELDDLVKKL